MQLSMFQQLMKMYKNPKLNLKKMPDITFSGEHGADVGGLTKEFFHNAISSLTTMDHYSIFSCLVENKGTFFLFVVWMPWHLGALKWLGN